jgi:hypothetical protein
MAIGRQAGEGKIGCIFWILVFGLSGLVAYKMLPIKMATVQLYDFMDEQAKWAERRSPEAIQKAIVERAKQLDLPIERENVRVERRGERILMEATYTVPVEFPGYTHHWHFSQRVDRTIYLF